MPRNPKDTGPADATQFASNIRDSAQQIWLAGLGAFAKAQEEGSKVFDTLVKEGVSMQKKTQSTAEEKFTEATARMSSMANDFGARAAGQWGKLEGIFEERVAKAMGKMGMPTAEQIAKLEARVAALEQAAAAPAKKAPAKKAAPKAKAAATSLRKPPASRSRKRSASAD
ncbi:phasin family protein [Variovorax sp. VNK109]|uniref:phasin family protein n=1 Tax=Variovorax sp. VNK109 TaxID=3400919 RepID=UPI003C062875